MQQRGGITMSKVTSAEVIAKAVEFYGANENDGSHKKIVDIYNGYLPHPRGYKVKYNDSWCATYVSAVAILLGCTDIIPVECGCEEMIKLFKSIGCWIEDDSYIPSEGDVIFYDWQDSGVGDNKGHSDHVGYVVSVSKNAIKVIEGNKDDKVVYRYINVNGKFIRGYGVPKYAKANDVAIEGNKPISTGNAKVKITASALTIRETPKGKDTGKRYYYGEKIVPLEKAFVNGEPWFRTNKGWISAKYLEGWILEDGKWWYLTKGYTYPTGKFEVIDGKCYCFDCEGWMLTSDRIKPDGEVILI